jgi:hypothetical protein
MKILMVAALFGTAGCAPAVFHDGRTTLARREQPCLASRNRGAKRHFRPVLSCAGMRSRGLLRWDASKSFVVSDAPSDLLQAIRDEVGRLNESARLGEDLALAVTVYRFRRAALWHAPAAYYELVARDMRGQVVWALDDKIEAREELARTLVDPPSAIIAREILRKLRSQFNL